LEVVSGTSHHLSDIDVLFEGTEFGVQWAGFAHPTAVVQYHVGLGTTPGLDNVVSLTPVGGEASSHVFRELTLLADTTYYATVVADTGFSRSNSSSNGVLVLGDLQRSLQLATVYDGSADMDVEYHTSLSQVSARWSFPAGLHARASHYMWAVGVVIEQASGSGSGGLSPVQFTAIRGYENVGKDTSGVTPISESELSADATVYINAVQACFATRCLPPVYSDGFRFAQPPISGALNATYTPLQLSEVYGTSALGQLELEWEGFRDPQLASYEWSLGTGEEGAELLVGWQEVEWFNSELSIPLNVTVSLHYPNTVTLRGYNSAGLHAVTHTALLWNVDGVVMAQDSIPLLPLIVYDVATSSNDPEATSWQDLVHTTVTLQDSDYTSSMSSLSGAWPGLRYTQYQYSVSTVQEYSPCSAQEGVACGSTFHNSATVSSLSLTEGTRYYFCVLALAEDAIHRTPSTPPVLEACSNGVTVDVTPPRGGCVKITPQPVSGLRGGMGGSGMGSEVRPQQNRQCTALNDTRFQVSTSDLYLIWEEFVDVEVYGNTVHESAVATYSYAIGKDLYSYAIGGDLYSYGLRNR
jgi:hypothetical protein